MGISNNFNLKNAMLYGIKRVVRALYAPIQTFYRKIVRMVSPTSIVGKVSSDVKNEIKRVGKKPSSLKEYYAIGEHYIAKKIVYVLILILILLPVVYIKIVFPWVESRFLVKTMVINSLDMQGYTGKVRLVGDKELENVIFEGTLTDGRIQGQGVL